MPEKSISIAGDREEIKLPIEFVDKIDKIIKTGTSIYKSREDFIKGAVEIKLRELKGFGPG